MVGAKTGAILIGGMSLATVSTIITVVSTAYQMYSANKMKKKMAAQRRAAAEARKGFEMPIRGTIDYLPVVYGKQLVGGVEVGHKVGNSFGGGSHLSGEATFSSGSYTGSGSKNEYLTVQSAIAISGISQFVDINVNEQRYNYSKAKFSHHFRTFRTGGTACSASTAAGFPATNKFTNCAWVSSHYKLNRDEANYNGVPHAQYLIKGQAVKTVLYDPTAAVGSQYSLSADGSEAYSNNPALCLLDYLLSARYGRGISENEVDLPSFYHAMNICATVVKTGALIGGRVNGAKPIKEYSTASVLPNITSGLAAPATDDVPAVDLSPYLYKTSDDQQYYSWSGGNYSVTTPTTRDLPLYECNVSLDSASTVRDNMETILDTMGMAELTWSSEGKYKLLLEYPQQTAAEIAAGNNECAAVLALVHPTHRFTEDDIIRDDMALSWPAANDRYNQITVNFSNEHQDFKEDSVTWPPTSADPASPYMVFKTEDNDQPFTADMDGLGLTDPYHALARAEQIVRQSREMKTIAFTVGKAGLSLEPGDFVSIYSPASGIGNSLSDPEVFRVQSIKVQGDLSVKLEGYCFKYSMLAWNINDDIPYAEVPEFDFRLDPPSNLLYNGSNNHVLGTSSGQLTWTPSPTDSTVEYVIEVKEKFLLLGTEEPNEAYTTLGVTKSVNIDPVTGALFCKFDIQGLKTGTFLFSVRARNAIGMTSVRITNEQSLTLKTVGKVAVIYADIQDHTDAAQVQTYTPGLNAFVAYYAYTGDIPPSDATTGILSPNITTNISFAKFVPDPVEPLTLSANDYTIAGFSNNLDQAGVVFFATEDNSFVGLEWDQTYQSPPSYGWPNRMYIKLNGKSGSGKDLNHVLHGAITTQTDLTMLIKHDENNWGTYKTVYGSYDGYSVTSGFYYVKIERVFEKGNFTNLNGRVITIGVSASTTRGAGFWKYLTTTATAVTGLSDAAVDVFFNTGIGLYPTYGDRFVLENTGGNVAAYIYQGSAGWLEQTEFIDGDLLVNGTVTTAALAAGSVTAEKIEVSSTTATIYSGTGPTTIDGGTANSTAQGVYLNGVLNRIECWDSGKIRVMMGNLSNPPTNGS
jgi:hypothetical protein